MARVILKQLGVESLVRVVRNPFSFFYLYNEAAGRGGQAPVFSDRAVHFIKTLEDKYEMK